ncbi:Serum response factor like protein A [Dictyocoela muelleri]|nr:Serum response factor like protein A [Dictyocoela muelleri]
MNNKNQNKKETQTRNYDEQFKDDQPKYEKVKINTIKTDNTHPKQIYRKGKRKIRIEYIKDDYKRGVTFTKRKKSLMKKAFELSRLTNSEILLIVADNTGVYTFASSEFKSFATRHDKLIKDYLKKPCQFEDGIEMTDYMSKTKFYVVNDYYNYNGNNNRCDSSSYYSGTNSGYIDEKENITNMEYNTSSYFSDDEKAASTDNNNCQDEDNEYKEYTPHYKYPRK